VRDHATGPMAAVAAITYPPRVSAPRWLCQNYGPGRARALRRTVDGY